MPAEYDVLVVGSRVAGASLALLLGRHGRRVLLVDRDRFPSDTLSTHYLGPPAVAALAQLGVLEDVEANGLRRLARTRTYVGDCVLEGPAMPVGQGYALAPRRDRLDAILIRHALAHPTVEMRERTRAVELLRDGSRVVGAVVAGPEGERSEIRARAVVGADGKSSDVARWVAAPAYETVPALRPAYYGYFRGVEPLGEPALEIFFAGDHIGFDFPMEPDLDCLAVEMQPGDFEVFRRDAQRCLEARLRDLPGMARRMRGARLEGPAMGTRGIENYFRVPYGPGWALTGDAGYCKDPSTGLGIGDAFTQSFLLAEAIHRGLDGDWDEALSAFHKRRDEALMPLYRATLAYTQAPAVPVESVDLLRAVLCSPPFARQLALGFAATLAASPAFAEPVRARLGQIAQTFAVQRAPGPR